MPAPYTLPFSSPQRIAGPGTFSGSDISLPQYFPQNVVFTNGRKTRYAFLVNGFQAAGSSTDSDEKWTLAGGIPPYKCYIHVMKSSDGGATWAEVGTPQAKELPPQNANDSVSNPTTLGYLSVSCWQDGSKILVLRPVWDFVTYSNTQPHKLVISVFDMTIDNWAADLSSASDANAPLLTNGNFVDQWTAGASPYFIVKRPSDGHIFALYKQTEFVDTRQSGTDLVIVAAGTPPSGSDLQIVSGGGSGVVVHSASYAFQPSDAGLTVYISATSPGTWNPGAYLIAAVAGGNADLNLAPQGLPGNVGATGGVWSIVGANKVSSASHGPYTAADQGYGLQITAGTGFVPGNYIITGFDGSGNAILSQNVGTMGSTGGSWIEARNFTFGEFDRCFLSEFNGAAWLPAQANVFGQDGVVQNFMPCGLALGDDSRLHLFCEQQQINLAYPPTVEGFLRNILIRSYTAAGALESIQTIAESQATNGSAANYFLGTPRTRQSGGQTEILLPWLQTLINVQTGNNSIPMALQLTRFLSADVPTLATDTVASAFAPLNFNADQCAPCWVPVINRTTNDLFVITQGASNTTPNAPTNDNLILLTETAPGVFDAGTNIFVDSGNTQSLGSITANSLVGSAFIAIVLSWNTDPFVTGDIPWGDPWYFEIAFAGPVKRCLQPS